MICIVENIIGFSYKSFHRHLIHGVRKEKLVLPFSTSVFKSTSPQIIQEPQLDELYKTIEIEVKGHDNAVLRSYGFFATLAAKELGITVAKMWEPPKIIERRALLRSVHIFGKHRVHYETRTHFRIIQLKHLTGSTADTYLEYIQRNLPEGVAMKVTKYAIERIPEHIKPPPENGSNPSTNLPLMHNTEVHETQEITNSISLNDSSRN